METPFDSDLADEHLPLYDVVVEVFLSADSTVPAEEGVLTALPIPADQAVPMFLRTMKIKSAIVEYGIIVFDTFSGANKRLSRAFLQHGFVQIDIREQLPRWGFGTKETTNE